MGLNNSVLDDHIREKCMNDLKPYVTPENVNEFWTPLSQYTFLHLACCNSRQFPDLVEWACNVKGCNVNARSLYKETPLMTLIGSNNGSVDVVKTLIKHGADIYASSEYDGNVVHLCVETGNYDCCAYFLSLSKHFLHEKGQYNYTPIQKALIELCYQLDTNNYLYLSLVKLLIDSNPSFDYSCLPPACVKPTTIRRLIEEFKQNRADCKLVAQTLLGLRKCNSKTIGSNGKDVLGLIAKRVWGMRMYFTTEKENTKKQKL